MPNLEAVLRSVVTTVEDLSAKLDRAVLRLAQALARQTKGSS
jgi:hypothetical protein